MNFLLSVVVLLLFISKPSLSARNCKQPFNLRSVVPRTTVPAWTHPEEELCIFCYTSAPKDLSNIFITATLKIQISDEDFELYVGKNASDVREKYSNRKGSWIQLLPWKATLVEMKPFEQSCLGLASRSSYHTNFATKRLDLWRVAYVVLATLLFLNAERICSSVFLYYTTGTALGVLGFALILVYIFSRYMPKRPLALTVVVGGWSMALYMMQWMWENMMEVLLEYRHYFYMYLLATGLLSFGFLYRYEPMTHSRSRDLLRWSLQGVGLLTVLWSSHIMEAMLAYDILLLLIYNFPPSWTKAIKLYWIRKYPPKRRLLTEEEYILEGNEETKKALDELRRYCDSPDCNSWKLVSRLKTPQRRISISGNLVVVSQTKVFRLSSESPDDDNRYSVMGSSSSGRGSVKDRFAEFVGGSPHLTDTEVLEHSLWEDPDQVSDDDASFSRPHDESDDELVPNGR